MKLNHFWGTAAVTETNLIIHNNITIPEQIVYTWLYMSAHYLFKKIAGFYNNEKDEYNMIMCRCNESLYM